LRRDYCDTITQLSNTAVHGKNVDNKLINYGAEVRLVDKHNNGRTARDLAKGSDRVIKAHDGEEPDFYMYKDRIILL
jgi:hypothetical protein